VSLSFVGNLCIMIKDKNYGEKSMSWPMPPPGDVEVFLGVVVLATAAVVVLVAVAVVLVVAEVVNRTVSSASCVVRKDTLS
jgi:hypothetical protein